jgi:uncharacterized protein
MLKCESYIFKRDGKTLIYNSTDMSLELYDRDDLDFSQDLDEFILDQSVVRVDLSQPGFNRLRLHLTSRCNLGCTYCCADSNNKKDDLSITKIKYAIDYLVSNPKGGPPDINFFGRGEPTLAWDVMIQAIDYARVCSERTGLDISFSLTSNGTWGNDRREYIVDNFDYVEISMDGPRDIHNKYRMNVAGTGSFDTVFENVKFINDHSEIGLSLSVVVTDQSVGCMSEIASFLNNSFPRAHIHMDPVDMTGHRIGENSVNAPSVGDFLKNFMQCKVAIEESSQNISLSTSLIQMDGNRITNFCPCSGSGLVVSPSGDVGSCERIYPNEAGAAQFIYGRIGDGGMELELERYRSLSRYDSIEILECQKCYAQYFCRGGCPFLKVSKGDRFWEMPASYCSSMRESIEEYFWYISEKN